MEQIMQAPCYSGLHFPAGLLKDKRLEKRGCPFSGAY